jgi:hypothetical protein
MRIWDKFGFGSKKEGTDSGTSESQHQAPNPSPEEGAASSLVKGVGDERLNQLLAANLGRRPERPIESEADVSLRIERYLDDVLPEAKKGEEAVLHELRTFSSEGTKAALLKKWNSIALHPGVKKKSFPDLLSDTREEIIKKLESAEEYRAVVQHVHDAFQEAGKNAEGAIKVLERRAAEIERQTSELVRQGVMDDRVARFRMQSKRLYAAVNKLDELIQKS